MNYLEVVKFICLVVGIGVTYTNTVKAFRGQDIGSAQTLLMAFSVAGFIYLQWPN